MASQPSRSLETFANPAPEKDYLIHMELPEFTCLCPKTGQPDFAWLTLDYVPDQLNVELKSLKLYLWSFRDEGAFHEAVTHRILEDLVTATQPRFMRLLTRWNVRGGIFTHVLNEHRLEGWQPRCPLPPVQFSSASPWHPPV
ncbi:MAG: NADPH-dependent 7-cyano-7-deazaguanine reductase QueF [Ferrovum sp.]|nr:NADPH-dependent 7-cyano-7-deazaguanine reductase QueF [Ferrovum sp.]NDU86946.1 NADPH-dependent 7-cyano-7-deazaguanine reductase QueF [Ferrovum sp.]